MLQMDMAEIGNQVSRIIEIEPIGRDRERDIRGAELIRGSHCTGHAVRTLQELLLHERLDVIRNRQVKVVREVAEKGPAFDEQTIRRFQFQPVCRGSGTCPPRCKCSPAPARSGS